MLPPLPDDDESGRLAAVRRAGGRGPAARATLDALTRFAAAALNAPIALVSIVDEHHQWFQARHGLDATGTPRDVAFCAHAIRQPELFIVEDARMDPRFADNPLVTGEPGVAAYAGMPLETEPGRRVGTLCVIDRRARRFTPEQQETLRQLGELVAGELRQTVTRKDLERELGRSKRNAQLARAHMARADLAGKLAGMGWWEFDVAESRVRWSREVYRIHGVGLDYKPSLNVALDFYEPDARTIVEAALRDAIEHARPFKFELPIAAADGRRRWVRCVGEPTLRAGQVIQVGGAIQDVTEEHEARAKAEHLARHDTMTGLANRAHFNETLARSLDSFRARSGDLALILLDVDHFKAINDTLGHDAGDAAIVEVARRLQTTVRAEDTVARLGGDEFAVIAPGVGTRVGLGHMLDRLMAATAEPWRWNGLDRRLALSVGAALSEPGLETGDLLYKAADVALYEAKAAGRGRYRVYAAPPKLVAVA